MLPCASPVHLLYFVLPSLALLWQTLQEAAEDSGVPAEAPDVIGGQLLVQATPAFPVGIEAELGSLLEAAMDLGAGKIKAFWTITVPLSKTGIIAGSMLVFIPVVGEFVIPELLGGPETLMIGKVLWQEFFNNRDWPVASALAVVMLAILIVPIILFNRNQAKELEGRP